MAAKLLAVLASLNALTGVSAFWRMECRGRLGLARIDPMMADGETSEHVHSIFGSKGFSETATFDDLVAGECTSCAVTEDMSAYWTPSMYFQHANGTYEIVNQVGGMLAYYLARDPNNNVKAFPKGFRMIAGSSLRRDYTVGDPQKPDPEQSAWSALDQTSQDDLEQRAIGFNCLDYNKTPEGALYRHYMPDKAYLDQNCLDGVRLEIAFPSCWNGKDVDSEDHKSHMAYPNLVQNGWCPDDFPVRLVTLFYESIWDTHAFKDQEGEFVIANGDVSGYGYHGDFMTGWDPDFLQKAVDQCTNESGLLTDCPLFTLQSEATQNQCKMDLPAALAKEDVLGFDGLLKGLPGNVKIQLGPQSATVNVDNGLGDALTSLFGGGSDTSSTSYVAPTLSYSADKSTSVSGGGIYVEQPTTPIPAPAPASTTSTSTFSTPAVTSDSFFAASDPEVSTVTTTTSASDPNVTYMPVSTEYVTNGAQVTELVWEEAVVYVTEDTVTTVTVSPLERRNQRRERRAHLGAHRHYNRF